MLTIQNLSYKHSGKDLLFRNINWIVNPNEKISLIGNNGIGKSTLLKIIAGDLPFFDDSIKMDAQPYYVPQIFGQFNHLTLAEALKIDKKIAALHKILNGDVSETNYDLLGDDWNIEERCAEALAHWQLTNLDLFQKMGTLSGGQKTKVFLAGISIHQPKLLLLDEPSNHLDISGREILYNFIQNSTGTIIAVSHDRKLLNLLDKTCELNKNGILVYGGNYDFYLKQKEIEIQAIEQSINSKETVLKKARKTEQQAMEQKQKTSAHGLKRAKRTGVSKAVIKGLRRKAEGSSGKLKDVHEKKIGNIRQELQNLRDSRLEIGKMKIDLDNSMLHKGKILFTANAINFNYEKGQNLWENNLTFQILSGERIVIKGKNGSGKTTLIKIILGELTPQTGTVFIAENKSVYIDQNYSLINNDLRIYEQAQQFNQTALQEHEIKIRLNRFLFPKETWDKKCNILSGGEKMRLMICCLSISNQSPDMIVLDEPTNNLDIQNIEILIQAINDYQGTLLAISHDETFLKEINIERTIEL